METGLLRKYGLFEKLREKLKLRKENHSGEKVPETSNKTRSRAKQSTRKIEIGWIHTGNELTKQVRAKQGGGTRKVTINIQAGFDEILKQGKALFFPEGESSKGHKSDFEFEVWDFKKNPLPKDVSIEKIYNTVKLPISRFYIATQPKPLMTEESDDDPNCDGYVSEPDIVPAERSTLEFTDEPHNYLQGVFIFSEESITESSIMDRENPTSSSHVASTSVNIISVSQVIEADTSDPEIIFGAQQTVVESPQSPLHMLPEITLVLHHLNSFIF